MSGALTAWTMWFFMATFYAYQYVLRVLPNVIIGGLINKFQVGALEIGNFSGIYYIGYTLMHIPISIILDRFGIKKIIPLCITLTSLGLLPLIYVDTWGYSVLGRLLIGIASSASVLGLFKVVRIGFGEEKFSQMIGIAITVGLLGAMYGGPPVHHLVSSIGWESVVKYFAILGLVLAAAVYCSIPKSIGLIQVSNSNLASDLKAVILNGRILFFSFLGGLMVGPLEGFADAWGAMFLKQMYNLSQKEASAVTSSIFLGMCIGCPLFGYIAEKTHAYYGLTLLSASMMAAGFLAVFLGYGHNIQALYVLFFTIGVFSGYQLLIIDKVRAFVPSHLADIASALANMVIMIFGYVFHSLIGLAIEIYSSYPEEKGVASTTLYSTEVIFRSLFVIPEALCIAIVGLIILMIGKKRFGY